MSIVDDFRAAVLDPISVAGGGVQRNYLDYLALPPAVRTGDEADVVDLQFTRNLLTWLGWAPGDWRYNATSGKTDSTRPDYRVLAGGRTAFVVEDKSTSLDWTLGFVAQMRGYATGTSGLVLWTNARELRLLRFQIDGTFTPLAVAAVRDVIAPGSTLFGYDEEALHTIWAALAKERFIDFPNLCQQACADLPRTPLDNDTALSEFIEGAQVALEEVARSATQQVRTALATVEDLRKIEAGIVTKFNVAVDALLPLWPVSEQDVLLNWFNDLRGRLGTIAQQSLSASAVPGINPTTAMADRLERCLAKIRDADSEWRLYELERDRQETIEDAYELWRRRQPDIELASLERFAEQTAYVVFIRLLLIRILEDKTILPQRIASNGGFDAWLNLVLTRFGPSTEPAVGSVFGSEFLNLLFRTASTYYSFEQPIFAWFEIDDFGLVRLLVHLNSYDFSDISNDVIGYTYERYIDRTARSEKGQFLTRGGIVDYLLDQIEYQGQSIIGRTLLDHACGSGSFLVRAARRLRLAIEQGFLATGAAISKEELSEGNSEVRLAFANKVLEHIEDLVGLDIDPFACYLAELNLLIQVLNELAYIWSEHQEPPFRRFNIFNSDGLELPENVLHMSLGAPATLELPSPPNVLDEGDALKALREPWNHGFDFISANPPFVSVKKQPGVAASARYPFFENDAVAGDVNLYLLFFRLAERYLADGGMAGIISPVNLCGDESGEKVRRLCTTGRLRLRGLTRFTSSTVLFDNVDHWMMVSVFQAGSATRPSPDIRIRYGFDELEASTDSLDVPSEWVTQSVPAGDQSLLEEAWRSPWLLLTTREEFELSRRLGTHNGWLYNLFANVAEWRQGDVNASAVNAYRRAVDGPGRLGLYTGGAVQPWAPLPDPDVWAEPPVTKPSSGVGAQLFRLGHLDAQEVGLLLGVQQNLHVDKRLRATWFERGPGEGFVFTHSTWRILAQAGHEERMKALLALLNSDVVNFLFGAWSTNFNVTQALVLRLPCPDPDSLPEQVLAEAVDSVLEARRRLAEWEGAGRGAFQDGVMTVNVPNLLQRTPIQKVSLSDALLSGTLSLLEGRSGRVDRILTEGRLVSEVPGYVEGVSELLWSAGPSRQLSTQLGDVLLPRSDRLAEWSAALASERVEGSTIGQEFQDAERHASDEVSNWYGLTEFERSIASNGMAWSYRRARARHAAVRQAHSHLWP